MPDPLLQDMVRIVSEARSRAAIAKLTLMAKQEQFKQDHAALYQEDSDARIVLETAEAALRKSAKEHVDAHNGVTSALPAGVGARKGGVRVGQADRRRPHPRRQGVRGDRQEY
jgi:hypothetical protein